MKRKLSALISIILCLAMCFSTFAWADEASPSPSASPAPDVGADAPDAEGPEEVIYARLDASGDPQDAYAIVALTLTEDGTVEHYGRYTAVSNLTDTSPIEYRGGVVSLTAPAGRYYYQGTLRSAKMPWDIEITYTLNGKEIDPADLGGKSGKLEVNIHTSTNSGFDPYFTENFMLQISVTLDADLCEDIAARNGTVANAGSDKQITFVVLPGGEGDIGFSAKVHDFTMGGFTIAAVPYSMDSLMDMGEISTITSGIEQLSSAITQLTGGASAINDGAATLGENGPTLTDASDQIESALRQIADGLQGYDLSSMTDGLDQLKELPAYLTEAAAGLDTISQGLVKAADGYDLILSKIKSMASSLGDLDGMKSQIETAVTQAVSQAIAEYALQNAKLSSDNAELSAENEKLKAENEQLKEQLSNKTENKEENSSQTNGSIPSGDNNDITGGSSSSGLPEGSTGGIPSFDLNLDEILGGITIPTTEDLNALVTGMTTANKGLRDAASGIDLVVDGLMQMAIGISSGLKDMTDFDTSAITEMQTGMAQLADSYEQFNEGLKAYTDGVTQLSDGMDTYTSGMYALNSQTQGIPDLLDEFLGTGDDADGEGESSEDAAEVVSFLDDRNTDTASVQFVISTDGISAPEEPAEEQPAEEPKGFFANLWDKIVALFT